MDILLWLQKWYQDQCDGDWEHLYGVKIDNIDNPGWSVSIDLVDTSLINKEFDKIRYDYGDDNWLICQIKNNKFEGAGDPSKLVEILTIFKQWVENS
ncbi:immunity 53 family protein [Enterococcus sp. BWB1-3]|uniref:immunity 53 family protein n=1 Tax=unclassified Enterococcus TaxID=2608891 RepID=UPI0019214712|nr:MULTISPECIES: immunity 53 family protein [unclassified Enterococcus]MBL1230376.1 immunity 53 family protein [Enterococcus sp. BWB1-3]MCB5955159.1 immunity 53 family protein [Enterococcus sp. CWB-B31]